MDHDSDQRVAPAEKMSNKATRFADGTEDRRLRFVNAEVGVDTLGTDTESHTELESKRSVADEGATESTDLARFRVSPTKSSRASGEDDAFEFEYHSKGKTYCDGEVAATLPL